jgi:DNA-binding transcriptional LysR family regulator
VREAGSSATVAAVLAGELDLGIVTMPVVEAGGGKPALAVEPLVEDELRLIVPARHALAERRGFRWADLAGQPVIAFEAGTAVRGLIDQASAAAGVVLDVVMELRSIESIKQMVGAGIGVGFVSRFALREGEGLTCKDGRLSRRLALVRRADRRASPAGAEFARALAASVRGA